LDLGSNTFHLLIVEKKDDQSFEVLYRKRQYTKLSKAGGDLIAPDSFQKGIDCLKEFRTKMEQYSVSEYKALGTETLRKASNGPLFIQTAQKESNISIELIDGNQEAQFIAKGVQRALKGDVDDYLIMDIGGGSIEFIQIIHGTVHWFKSFPLGLGVLKKAFPHNEPITQNQIEEIEAYLEHELYDLWEQLKLIPLTSLTGASGSFEVLVDILQLKKTKDHYVKVGIDQFNQVYHNILCLDANQRTNHPGIPPERADLIVIAFILMRKVSSKMQALDLYISDFAIKEGIIESYF